MCPDAASAIFSLNLICSLSLRPYFPSEVRRLFMFETIALFMLQLSESVVSNFLRRRWTTSFRTWFYNFSLADGIFSLTDFMSSSITALEYFSRVAGLYSSIFDILLLFNEGVTVGIANGLSAREFS
jgi:hypothetical protein